MAKFDPQLIDPLDASLQDFEPSSPPRDDYGFPPVPSHPAKQLRQHLQERSGSLRPRSPSFDGSEGGETDVSEPASTRMNESAAAVSAGGYSPPAWRRLENGDRSDGFWRPTMPERDHDLTVLGPPLLGRGTMGAAAQSMQSTHGYESADEGENILHRASMTRLPTGSLSPERMRSPEPRLSTGKFKKEEEEEEEDNADNNKMMAILEGPQEPSKNYIRFAVRAEVQQRTEPIETVINFLRSRFSRMTRSWGSLLFSTMVAFLSISATRSLFRPATAGPSPDLVKVAHIAKSFEPLIYVSESGISQVGDLQATGVAVWDLGESVRNSNMSSAPSIVRELDDLSDSLKTLALELTKFFANVDGDVDGILIVMDWARRELSQLQSFPSQPLSTAFDNIHNLLSSAGILEDETGAPTRLGSLAMTVFGLSMPQRTRMTLQRTFHEFLAVLEEAVSTELQHSLSLFGLFEAIDRQFLNLARTVVREASIQDERHADLLSGLWTRILGARASEVRKYERNRHLLQNVREKTVRNKGLLVEHNQRLLALKANLEQLRRRLVSPLIRNAANGSTALTIDEQVRGLEDVATYLEGVRQRQKGKLLEMLYGSPGGRRTGQGQAIESS